MTVAVEAFTASQPLSYKDQEAERAVLVFFLRQKIPTKAVGRNFEAK